MWKPVYVRGVIVVVVVVYDDTYYWVYLSFDHQIQVDYKARQFILLQSATAFLLQRVTSVITKCDRTNGCCVRNIRCSSL